MRPFRAVANAVTLRQRGVKDSPKRPEAPMSQVFSEETHRNLLSRIPHCTGREVSEWLRAVDEGPSLLRFEEKVSWLRGEHNLAYGHAKAIIHEHDLRRAARNL
ncbi:hypothetical protein SCA03_18830 [Streptomyces cacaoi]|uniref:DUF4287 domain-containing protein n=2 Tax=Streptomyces TaxID=1883 RepID=A0A4Y3QVU2_STRCI|nr:hypothetical protein SCA03_18830 [Streptomyces cacaoi]